MPGTEPQRQDFQTGWPRFYKDGNGVPMQFEVRLSENFLTRMGLSDPTIVASVDDSTQYRSEGLCWRVAAGGKQGQRLEREDVAGWRIPTRQVGMVVGRE